MSDEKNSPAIGRAKSLLTEVIHHRGLVTKGVGYKAFIKFMEARYGTSHGFTKSSVTKLISKLNRVAGSKREEGKELTRADSFKAEEYIRVVAEFIEHEEGHAKNYHNKCWYFYFFYYKNHENSPPLLGRAVMHIDDVGKVFVKNIPDDITTDYTGKFRLINDEVLYFNLKGENENQRLNVKVLSGKQPKDIALGICTSFEHHDLVSNTLVLENMPYEELENMRPGAFDHRHEEFYTIDESIRKYLSPRAGNRMKVSREIRSKKALKELIEGYKKRKMRSFIDPDKPILFISTPTISIKNEEYDHEVKRKIVQSIEKSVKEQLEQQGVNIETSYPGAIHVKSEEAQRDLIKYYRVTSQTMRSLHHTKYFVLIYDEKAISKSLIELGYALSVCKTVLVLYREGVGFPDELSFLATDHYFENFTIRSFTGALAEAQHIISVMIFRNILANL